MKVWDCVLVNDELDLLELRFRLLEDVVDRFVVVEADRTFRGAPKPAHVALNLDRFSRWATKLELIQAELPVDAQPWAGGPPPTGDHQADALARATAEAWTREHAQEHAQLRGLTAADPADIVLLGDVDEIPSPHAVRWIRESCTLPVRLTMRQAMYRANWEFKVRWCDGPLALRAGDLHTHPMAMVMLGLPSPDLSAYREDELIDAGWHLTSLGTATVVRRKLDSYSHVYETEHDGASAGMVDVAQRLRVHHLGHGRLRTLARDELDEQQRDLLAMRPDLFDFTAPPPTWRGDAHSVATVLQRRGLLPARLVRSWKRGAMPLLPGLALVGVEHVRSARRNRKADPWAWKRGRMLRIDADRAKHLVGP